MGDFEDFEDRQKKEDEGCAFFACAVCVLIAFFFRYFHRFYH